MEVLEFILELIILAGFIYHFTSYKKSDTTPYHGIMALIYLIVLGIGSVV